MQTGETQSSVARDAASGQTSTEAGILPDDLKNGALTERLRAAAEMLEAIARNRALLAGVPEAERTRLLQAAGQVSRPDALDRRRLVKASKRNFLPPNYLRVLSLNSSLAALLFYMPH